MLGIFYTIRKLDAQSRSPEQFPHVEPAAFLEWRAREAHVYSTAVLACFLKIFLDLGFTYFFAEEFPPNQVRLIGATIDLSWLAVVFVTFFRANAVRKLRQRLGIVLGGFIVSNSEDKGDEDSDEPRES